MTRVHDMTKCVECSHPFLADELVNQVCWYCRTASGSRPDFSKKVTLIVEESFREKSVSQSICEIEEFIVDMLSCGMLSEDESAKLMSDCVRIRRAV